MCIFWILFSLLFTEKSNLVVNSDKKFKIFKTFRNVVRCEKIIIIIYTIDII
jgi:hypothetical protein